jgi:hypothetical protein
MTAATPLQSVPAEATRLVDGLRADGVLARLLGGLGVAAHDHTEPPEALGRDFADIDLVVRRKCARRCTDALVGLGYEPNSRFNALHGARRMLFYDRANGRQLDVFVGDFSMCHQLDLDDRLDRHPRALSAADLFLTKLQIVELNHKDVTDTVRLVLGHEVVDTDDAPSDSADGDDLSLARVCAVTRTDWGWYTTVCDNVALVRDAAPGLLPGERGALVAGRLDALLAVMRAAPKTARWKARAMVGRRKAWYELPEEVDPTRRPSSG